MDQKDAKQTKPQDSSPKGDLEVNNLIYEQPKALSLATSRKLCRQYFQQKTYGPSETAVIVWNTGSSFVNTHNSYLTFKVATVGAVGNKANWGSGSAINTIQSITITSRSGTELERVDRLNLWARNEVRHSYSADWIERYGSIAGFSALGAPVEISATATRFVIPLNLISGFFRPVNDMLLPPQLASGLRIEIHFATLGNAMVDVGVAPTSYTITDISMNVDCVTLADDAQKSLNMESASSGLEYTYPRIHTSTLAGSGSTLNFQVRKAVSQAVMATTVLQDQLKINEQKVDSMVSEDFKQIDSFQYRLGSLYFPNSPLLDAKDGVEAYYLAQYAYDKCRTNHFFCDNSISVSDFKTKMGMMAVSLEKDTDLNLSGLPINNSRMLELNATLVDQPTNWDATLFLTYMSVAKCWIDNTAVSI